VKRVKISDLQSRIVINIHDGKRLGYISDVEIDTGHGRITAVVLPGEGKFFGVFGNGKETVIPWGNIVKIGIDCVLVRIDGDSGHAAPGASRGSVQ
jgi:YlmC/YmxH family sporulation protein